MRRDQAPFAIKALLLQKKCFIIMLLILENAFLLSWLILAGSAYFSILKSLTIELSAVPLGPLTLHTLQIQFLFPD